MYLQSIRSRQKRLRTKHTVEERRSNVENARSILFEIVNEANADVVVGTAGAADEGTEILTVEAEEATRGAVHGLHHDVATQESEVLSEVRREILTPMSHRDVDGDEIDAQIADDHLHHRSHLRLLGHFRCLALRLDVVVDHQLGQSRQSLAVEVGQVDPDPMIDVVRTIEVAEAEEQEVQIAALVVDHQHLPA